MAKDAEGRPIIYRNTAECDHDDCIYKWCFQNPDNWDYETEVEAFTGHRLWITHASPDTHISFGVSGEGISRILDQRQG